MDQFSHDLTVALEETSLLNRARVSWGQRRRTRSTGNLPSAPQPTEDSSSSPTDTANTRTATNRNIDGLNTNNASVLLSDSDEKDDLSMRFPCKPFNTTTTAIQRLATLESDSLNENFSPARFFKPNTRRKRKLKRMSVEYDVAGSKMDMETVCNTSEGNKAFCKRALKFDVNAHRSNNLFFCGKRKRSNRDRYHEHAEHGTTSRTAMHSCSMPRYNHWDEYRGMRPRSFSSTSKPHSERLLPLNKGLVSKIEKISQLQKTERKLLTQQDKQHQDKQQQNMAEQQQKHLISQQQTQHTHEKLTDKGNIKQSVAVDGELQLLKVQGINESDMCTHLDGEEGARQNQEHEQNLKQGNKLKELPENSEFVRDIEDVAQIQQQLDKTCTSSTTNSFQTRRIKKQQQHRRASRRRSLLQQQLQFAVDQYAMDCDELNDFLSSSSLSSSDSDDAHTANGTDREGDDELTDWPGNEFVSGGMGADFKRKLTKKSQLPQIRSDDMGDSGEMLDIEDSTTLEMRYQPSEPIKIAQRAFGFVAGAAGSSSVSGSAASVTGLSANCVEPPVMDIPVKQIESEMSGETSTNFLSSPPFPLAEVREIRAGCRRVKGERPGFSIKTSVNERLARFLQDARQTQIRLPDIEIYEHESLINLATLYSLQMTLDHDCVVLTKTSNTTQSVNTEQQNLQGHLFLSDLKRRCYDSQSSNFVPSSTHK